MNGRPRKPVLTFKEKERKNQGKFERAVQDIYARGYGEAKTKKLLNKASERQDARQSKLMVEDPDLIGLSSEEIEFIQHEFKSHMQQCKY